MPQRAPSAGLLCSEWMPQPDCDPSGCATVSELFLRTTEMLAWVIHGLRFSLNIDGNISVYLGTEFCFS